MTRARIVLTAAAMVLAATAGCGTATPPGEAVPGLRTQLSRVDAALADREYAQARRALDALTRETAAARDTGLLSAEQANRILAAAARLAADLPAQAPVPHPTVTVKVPQQGGEKGQERPQSDKKDDQKSEQDKDQQDKDQQDKDQQKKDDHGGGHNSGNGPDDGHGN
jgi:hypothetical protein